MKNTSSASLQPGSSITAIPCMGTSKDSIGFRCLNIEPETPPPAIAKSRMRKGTHERKFVLLEEYRQKCSLKKVISVSYINCGRHYDYNSRLKKYLIHEEQCCIGNFKALL
jgi:hypothetical protein